MPATLPFSDNRPADHQRFDPFVLLLVTVVAAAIAAALYLQYQDVARFRWGRMENDRNAHYLLGQSLALDLRHLDIRLLLADLDGARVWPPLHGILIGLTLLFGGIDYRLAVLPSLAGWIGTVILGFLTARRAVPNGGTLAGLVAAIFILASPAHRVFATDIMLESLGACLSLLVLYLYLLAVQEPTERSYRNMALALTALFLLKYNYWLLVAAGLLTARIVDDPKRWWGFIRERLPALGGKAKVRAELQNPLAIIALTSLCLMLIVVLTGGWKFELWGKTVSIRSHHNFLQVAYGALFLRALLWWRKNGRAWKQRADFPGRQLVLWHVWPVAIWLVLPKRLGYFLYFLSPANGPNSPASFWWGLDFYWRSLQEDYHTGMLSAVLAAGLLLVGTLGVRRLKPGALALVLFVILAAFLTIAHPNRKSRFLHSWVPAAWVLTGVGASLLLCGFATGRRRALTATAVVGLLGFWQLADPFTPGHSPEAGHRDLQQSPLDLSDFYLPYLSHSRHVTLFATVPVKHFAQWTFFENYKDRHRLRVFMDEFGPSREENRIRFQKWLRATRSDTIVFLDVPPGSPLYFPGEDFYQQYRDLLSSQSVFRPFQQRFFSQYGCTVSIWMRNVAAGQTATGSD
ncbi:MAG: hypothetical protein ACREQW_07155 [Candidatus Binatia bacterium]